MHKAYCVWRSYQYRCIIVLYTSSPHTTLHWQIQWLHSYTYIRACKISRHFLTFHTIWRIHPHESSILTCPKRYIRYHREGGLELSLLAIDWLAHTGDVDYFTEKLLPQIESYLDYYANHFTNDQSGESQTYFFFLQDANFGDVFISIATDLLESFLVSKPTL